MIDPAVVILGAGMVAVLLVGLVALFAGRGGPGMRK